MKTGTISEEHNYHCREIARQRDELQNRVDFLNSQNTVLQEQVDHMVDVQEGQRKKLSAWAKDYADLRRAVEIHIVHVRTSDKTPHYEYGSSRNSANRVGVYPPAGQRWLTPAELAETLRHDLHRLPKC